MPYSSRLSSTLRISGMLCVAAAAGLLADEPARAATTPPVPLQIVAVSANAPDAAGTVIQGQAIFDGTVETITYCIVDAAGKADRGCAVENVKKLLGSGDKGPSGGRAFQVRVDAGASGSVLDTGGTLTPILEPTLFITRIATADESYDGYFAFPLSIGTDSKTGKFIPVIGSHL